MRHFTLLPTPSRQLMALTALLLAGCGSDNNDESATSVVDAAAGDTDDAGSRGDADTNPCQLGTCDEIELRGESLADYDQDGFPDCLEPGGDVDGDGRLACTDDDSDGDGIGDAIEGYADADNDGTPNALDTDADGDGILDNFEGDGDPDEDGIPNFLDDDSDGDGAPDIVEYGRQPGSEGGPVDRDADGQPDFLDLDSDGDGLLDADETGCPESTDRTRIDSDGDQVTDLLEELFGADGCDPNVDLTGLVEFYFVLPYLDPEQSDTLEFATAVRAGDVLINIDTTGSMSGQINALKESLSGVIIPGLRSQIENIGVGVSAFEDFPCGSYGGASDSPFDLLQRITTDGATAQAAVDALTLGAGGDGPESGVESLFQAATGLGTDDCQPGLIPPFDPLRNYVSGAAEGTLGGAGFRPGAMPLVVHITDAQTHAAGEGAYPYGATRDEATDAMRDIGGRVIGVATNSGPVADLTGFANATDAVVPFCAWDGNRPAGCAPGQCCTGLNGAGQAPDSSGNCPLVLSVAANGSGLGQTIVDGIAALLQFAPTTVTTRVRPDIEEFNRSGIDTTCFVQSIIPNAGFQMQAACTGQPELADTNGDGALDGFVGVIPGAQLFFDIVARNDCVQPTLQPQTFFAYIDVIAGGDVILDTQLVTVLVPPDFKSQD